MKVRLHKRKHAKRLAPVKINNVLFLHLQRSRDNGHVEASTEEESVSDSVGTSQDIPHYERGYDSGSWRFMIRYMTSLLVQLPFPPNHEGKKFDMSALA
jgi:hypothetical protein